MELTFRAESWPIPAEVAVVRHRTLGIDGLKAEGRVRDWRPIERAALADELTSLPRPALTSERVQDDRRIREAYRDWVRQNGPFGVVGSEGDRRRPPLGRVELVEDIGEQLEHLSRAVQLRNALLRGDSDSSLRDLAESVAGLWVPAPSMPRLVGPVAPIGALTDTRAFALEALGRLVGSRLSMYPHTLGLALAGDAGSLHLRAEISPHGPVACAYAQLWVSASLLRVRVKSGRLERNLHAPRNCARCGTTFIPRTGKSAWCSARCRSAAAKAGLRNPFDRLAVAGHAIR